MSYILEALKKAQAERQLGTAPSIHTMPIPTAVNERSASDRAPLLMAAGGVLLALAAVVMWWRQGSTPAAPAAVIAAAPLPAPVSAPAPAPAVIVVPPSPSPAPAPVAEALPPAAPVRQAAPVAAAPAPAPAVAAKPPKPAAPPAAVAEEAPQENLPLATQLPEQVQRELPKLAFGGYMYSKNPADRLLLIDNVLRHEGQEVAPGLVLEQLQPRAAVMNYRGTRYKVAF